MSCSGRMYDLNSMPPGQGFMSGERMKVANSSRLRFGFLAFQFSTTWVRALTHSSTVAGIQCSHSATWITRSGVLALVVHAEDGVFFQKLPLGSAQVWMKPLCTASTSHLLPSTSFSKPALNHCSVAAMPMTMVQE